MPDYFKDQLSPLNDPKGQGHTQVCHLDRPFFLWPIKKESKAINLNTHNIKRQGERAGRLRLTSENYILCN